MQGEVLNISPVVVWVVALSQLLTFGLTIWGLMSSGSRANAKKIDEQGKLIDDQGKRIDGHDLRLGSVEQAQRAQPTKEDMHAISLALADMKGEMKAMRAEMAGGNALMERMEQILNRHEDHLQRQ